MTKPELLIYVVDAVTRQSIRVTGEEAMLLEALWRTVPAEASETAPGVVRLRRQLGWTVSRFDRVRYALHRRTTHRRDVLHEAHRPEYVARGGQARADKQPFLLHPLLRTYCDPTP